MMIFLLLLSGIGYATLPDACKENEFLINGYTTGQNIDVDYDKTEITRAADSSTQLTVAFTVPRVYTEQYEAAAFAITFNRDMSDTEDSSEGNWKDKITTVVGGSTNQAACYTNRYANDTRSPCTVSDIDNNVWGASPFTENGDNECLTDMAATVPWADVMTKPDGHFGNVEVRENGDYTEVFLLATVETWSHFRQTTDSSYQGQMTGDQQFDSNDPQSTGTTDRGGKYTGDGGDLDVHHPALIMDDERYTLYQIPFILRFPLTVKVKQTFQVGSKVTVLNAVVAQDVIQVDFNPDHQNEDSTFAALEVTVTTEVQHPYAIRGPRDESNAKMTAVVGGLDGGGAEARSIEFRKWDAPGSCRGVRNQETCSQDFLMRIIPTDANPCTVEGTYTLEFWATCIAEGDLKVRGGPNGCGLDELNTDASLATRRGKNGYFTMSFDVKHQSFCPEVMDTVKVVADFKAYHDEGFTEQINDNVFTNDIIYYEVTYRTASAKGGDQDASFVNNNDGAGGDSTIDYIRATKIETTVTLGASADGTAVAGWDATWKNNVDWSADVNWSLGGKRMAGEDFTGDGLTVISTPDTGDAGKIVYNIKLCEIPNPPPGVPSQITANKIQYQKEQPLDCFGPMDQGDGSNAGGTPSPTSIGFLARDYLDFNKVDVGESKGSANDIDENEVAFKFRLDERIIPIGPKTDNSHISLTVHAEVYYTGNRHPTRRLLQADATAAKPQVQTSIQSLSHKVHYKQNTLKSCLLDTDVSQASVELVFDYGSTRLPTLNNANNWALNFKLQLEKHLQIKQAVQVVKMTTSAGVLLDEIPNKGDNRRMEEDSNLHVTIFVRSAKHSSAGDIVNTLQTEISSGKMGDVYAFKQGTVKEMTVPECSRDRELANTKLVSSATTTSSLIAFAVASICLLA